MLVTTLSLVLGSLTGGAPVNAAPACALVPQLREITINQGLGSYPKLVQGKETLVRAYLSLPSCASSTQFIELRGGTLTVAGGGIANTVAAPFPAPVSPFPRIPTNYRTTPPVDAPGDPKFVIPGSFLDPGPNFGSYTATFTLTINYKASNAANPATITFPLQGAPAVTKTVEEDTNPLRILVVPMGDKSKSYATQYSATANEQVQLAMQTVSRMFPVPDGIGDLAGSAGGVRYTVLPTLLDLQGLFDPDGGFCLTGSTFDSRIKGQLATFAQSWESANPGIQIDVVIGVVDAAISKDSAQGCAQGLGATGSAYTTSGGIAAVRLVPNQAGGIAAMEIGHALGMVPPNRDRDTDPNHSPALAADAGSNRGYNLRDRSFLADDRTALYFSGSGFTNTNTLMEQLDYQFLLCALGGSTATDCSNPGVVGDNLAGPRFVLSGTVAANGLSASVVESYSAEVPATPPVLSSPFTLVQIDTSTATESVLRTDFVPVIFGGTHHGDGDHAVGVVDVAVPFNPDADRIEFRNGATVLDTFHRSTAPTITQTSVVQAGESNYTDDPSADDLFPAVSPDGAWVAWSADDGEGASRLYVGPIEDSAAAVDFFDEGLADEDQSHPAWCSAGDRLAFVSDGDIYQVDVDLSGDTPSFGGPTLIFATDSIEHEPDALHPTWSPDCSQLAFEWGSDIYRIDADGAEDSLVALTNSGRAHWPTWSLTPGDDRIAYMQENFSFVRLADAPDAMLVSYVRPDGRAPIAPADHGGNHFTVNTDDDDSDGECDFLHCSLREAIGNANATPNVDSLTPDVIEFNIPIENDTDGQLPHVIQPQLEPLPAITDSVIIDGTTEPDYVSGEAGTEFDHVPAVELDGSLLPSPSETPVNGLTFLTNVDLDADLSAVDGLVIASFEDSGIALNGTGNVTVVRSYIGTDPSGASDRGNGRAGILISNSTYTNVGTTVAETGNVISGNGGPGVEIVGGANANNNQLNRNYIGTDPTGTAAVPNDIGIWVDGQFNSIGATANFERVGNLISGNDGVGVRLININSSDNFVVANRIGTNAAGDAALPNQGAGVEVFDAHNNFIGGTGTNQGNLISGNTGAGISIGVGSEAHHNVVEGNLIGTDATGTLGIGNGLDGTGVVISGPDNVIGGSTAAARNVISGNALGIHIGRNSGSDVNRNIVAGNYIGTDVTGTQDVGNTGDGVAITGAGYVDNVVRGNVISGNGQNGVDIQHVTRTVVQGNIIGLEQDGTAPAVGSLGNGQAGVFISSGVSQLEGNTIGGTAVGEGNVISDNRDGIRVNIGAAENDIRGNKIGVEADGVTAAGNTFSGIEIAGDAGKTSIGLGLFGDGATNIIANNGGDGVWVASGSGHDIIGNSIDGNGGLGIDLGTSGVTPNDSADGDTGANDLINWPTVTSAVSNGTSTTVEGTIEAEPATVARLDVYSSPGCDASTHGEGAEYLGTTTIDADLTDGTGSWSLTAAGDEAGRVITATMSDNFGNTSEFSNCATVTNAPVDSPSWEVNQTEDADDGACTVLHCTLREAIDRANAEPNGEGIDAITFDIPDTTDTAPHTIAIDPDLGALPSIDEAVVIDASTEPDYSTANDAPVVQLDGTGVGGAAEGEPAVFGLVITGGGSTIRGLSITNFRDAGVRIVSDFNTLDTNYIGIEPDGVTAAPNGWGPDSGYGVMVVDADSNEIGLPNGIETEVANRNVISGNDGPGVIITGSTAANNSVENNYIGTNAGGTSAVPNGVSGVVVSLAAGTSIGGTGLGTGNVISGNAGDGVTITGHSDAAATIVQRNLIGTNAAGTGALPNDGELETDGRGVLIVGSSDNTVRGNVIAGNGGHGVSIEPDAGSTEDNVIVGNAIGVTAVDGSAALLGNAGDGVSVNGATGTQIGGESAGDGNIIGGNTGNGIRLESATFTAIEGNAIGTGVTGVSDLGNGGAGVSVGSNVPGAFIGGDVDGRENFIGFNGGDGVEVDEVASGIAILRNRFHSNGGLAIDLEDADDPASGVTPNDIDDTDTGANQLQNFPVIETAIDSGGTTTISGRIETENSALIVEFFSSAGCDASGFGEGQTYLGSIDVVTNAGGEANFTFDTELAAQGELITATATHLGQVSRGSSEFSACAEVTGPPSAVEVRTVAAAATSAGPGTLLVANASQPSWGTEGDIAFVRGGNIHTIGPDGTGEDQLTEAAADSMPFLGATTAFVRFVTDIDLGDQFDVFLLSEQSQVFVTATDDNPSELTLDLLYTCQGAVVVNNDVAVGVLPTNVTQTSANWVTNFDPSLACPGGRVTAVAMDSWNRVAGLQPSDPLNSDPKPPVAAIYEPDVPETLLNWDSLALHGSGKDAEDGELLGTALRWFVNGVEVNYGSCAGSRTHCDIPAPTGRWPAGGLTVRLEVRDSDGVMHFDEATIQVLIDQDKDGVPKIVEDQCSSDANAADAFADRDGDGSSAVDDYALFGNSCSGGTFGPDTLYVPSVGEAVTMTILIPNRDLKTVIRSSVVLATMSGETVNIPNTLWTVDKKGVATARFDRQVVIDRLEELGLVGGSVFFTVTGTSSQGWTFSATDAADVMPAN